MTTETPWSEPGSLVTGYNYLHVTRVQRRSYSVFHRLRAIEFIATVIHLSTGSPPLVVSV